MKDYQDLYLKRDVFLSADVFEKFRNSNLRNYVFRQSHYLLKRTSFKLGCNA